MEETDILALTSDRHVLEAAELVEQLLDPTHARRIRGRNQRLGSIWSALRAEVHELLCTNSARYKDERALIKSTGKPAIAALSAILTAKFGLEASMAIALSGLALLLPFRITAGAWCRAYQDSRSVAALELKELKKLRRATSNADPPP